MFNNIMDTIAFFDTEIGQNSEKIQDIGCIKTNNSSFHSGSVSDFIKTSAGNPDFQSGRKAASSVSRGGVAPFP